MMDRIRRIPPGLVVFLVMAALQFGVAFPTVAQQNPSARAGLKLYDNFDSAYINPARWYVQYGCSGVTNLECVRQI